MVLNLGLEDVWQGHSGQKMSFVSNPSTLMFYTPYLIFFVF